MRLRAMFLTATAALLPFAPAAAAERGVMRTSADLKTKPFIDAPSSGKLAANQKVSVTTRQAGWSQVTAGALSGWVRTLSLLLEAGSKPVGERFAVSGAKGLTAASMLTGSRSSETATGVKGLTAQEIMNVKNPDMTRVAQLASLAVDSSEASANAQQSGLKEQQIAYLTGGKK